MAHGVSSLYPPVSSSSCNSFVSPELKKTAMDVLCPASSLIFSFSGTGVLPSILVIINDCEIPGTVYSHPAAAAAARKLLTPGQISHEISYEFNCSICSLIAPYIEESPVCRRTISLFSLSAVFMTSIISSSVIYALL